MGVKGLQTFLKNNHNYLATRVELANSCVVVDANNLLCLLFTKTCLDESGNSYRNDIYGGDIVHYIQVVRKFFQSLEECKITPILIFDGSVIGRAALKDFVASKENEVYRRGLERFVRAKTMTETSFDGDLLLPQIINNAFRNVAHDLGIQRIQTPYEADAHIARVANELNCPVLTNDSDFIIYDLKQGFFMLDFFEYSEPIKSRQNPGETSIRCLLFSQSQLTKTMPGIRREVMPLLSILLGNDYVEAGSFDGVLRLICKSHYDGFFEARTFSHRRIANLLTWMRGKTLQESIDYILSQIHYTLQSRLRALINIFLRNYRIEDVDNLEDELERIYPSSKAEPAHVEHEQTPVKFLKKLMDTDDLDSIALDIIFKNTHYNYASLDDLNLPSSNYIKYRPISLALVLLRPQSHVNMTTNKRLTDIENSAFHIYDRLHGQYTKLIIKQMETLENFGSLSHLDCYSMIVMEPALKRNILMSCFYFNLDEMSLMTDTIAQVLSGPYIQEAAMCFILIKYIAIETKLPPKSQFVDALIMTHFYYAAISGNLNKAGIPNEAAYGKFLLHLRVHAKLEKGNVAGSEDGSIYRRIMHFVNQLHSAYKGFGLVNALLGHVFPAPRAERFLNSVFIFRLTRLFRLGSLNVADLCADLPILADICGSIQAQVHCAT